MAKFVYDKSKSTLEGHDQVWTVRSGMPGVYSPVPSGLYVAPKGALMAGKPGHGVPYNSKYSLPPFSYRDKHHFSWFLWLGKGELGIHPDGNVPGTKGCVGVVADDTKPLFEKFKQLNAVSPITIVVK